jgi:hypothetical protein
MVAPLDGLQRSTSFNSDSEQIQSEILQISRVSVVVKSDRQIFHLVSFWFGNQIADLSLFAWNGRLAKGGSPSRQPLLEGR